MLRSAINNRIYLRYNMSSSPVVNINSSKKLKIEKVSGNGNNNFAVPLVTGSNTSNEKKTAFENKPYSSRPFSSLPPSTSTQTNKPSQGGKATLGNDKKNLSNKATTNDSTPTTKKDGGVIKPQNQSSHRTTNVNAQRSSGNNNNNNKPNQNNAHQQQKVNQKPVVVHTETTVPQKSARPPPSLSSSSVNLTDGGEQSRFDTLPDISNEFKRAIAEHMGFEVMTTVQAKTLPVIIAGHDVLAKAKTGTGKTVAFLLPTLQKIISANKLNPRKGISCLILSPTRELACQTEAEARELLHFSDPKLCSVACVYGGTNIEKDRRQLSQPVDVLIATPGRLEDHLKTTNGFREKLGNCKFLVLDEADRLLEVGFRPALERIISVLPAEQRQSLLFSATVPESMRGILKIALKPDHRLLDCIGSERLEDQTHVRVEQQLVITDFQNQIVVLDALLRKHETERSEDFKILVFFPTARQVGYFHTVFSKLGHNVLEMHSRLTQSKRTKAADEFKESKKQIMFTSDVSARGMDYEKISLVIQTGVTDRETYIHRLGRTARAGENGSGVLLLCEFEEAMMRKKLTGVVLKEDKDANLVQAAISDVERKKAVAKAVQSVDELEKAQCYSAFLGCYNSHKSSLNMSSEKLVQMANEYSSVIGCAEVPALEAKIVSKMGLKNVPGIRLEERKGNNNNKNRNNNNNNNNNNSSNRGGAFRYDQAKQYNGE